MFEIIEDKDSTGHTYYYTVLRKPGLREYNQAVCIEGSTRAAVQGKAERLIAGWIAISEPGDKKE